MNDEVIQQERMVLLGDLNIDWLNEDSNTKKLKKIIEAVGLKQIVTKETRITNVSATLIDHIFTNDYSVSELPRNFPIISDHEIVGVEISIKDSAAQSMDTFYRNFNNDVISKVIFALTGANWNYSSTDVNIIYSDLMETIRLAVDDAAPKQRHDCKKYP